MICICKLEDVRDIDNVLAHNIVGFEEYNQYTASEAEESALSKELEEIKSFDSDNFELTIKNISENERCLLISSHLVQVLASDDSTNKANEICINLTKAANFSTACDCSNNLAWYANVDTMFIYIEI